MAALTDKRCYIAITKNITNATYVQEGKRKHKHKIEVEYLYKKRETHIEFLEMKNHSILSMILQKKKSATLMI